MNRNRQRDHRNMRDSRGGRGGFGLGDGLLGEGPPAGGPGPMMGANPLGLRDTQLALAQSLLQQQQLMNSGFGGAGADFSGLGALAGGMHFLQQQQQQMRMPLGGMGGGMGGMRNDRKRSGGQLRRDHDEKRGRRDSWGRGERDRSHGNINRSGQDRDRSRRDSDKDRKKQGEDYDPAEPTEDDDDSNKDKDGNNLYCHVCSVSVYDEESFQRHLNGLKHKNRMESIASVHHVNSSQMNFRLKAEEHLRNIERKGGRDPDYFCKICNNDLAIPWEKHRYSNIHKQRLLQVRKGCGWCKVHDFTNFTEVLEHRETDEHKKNAEIYGKKDEDKEDSRQRIKDGKERSKATDNKDSKAEEEEEDLTIPEYNVDNPVGLTYVIPVTGYFCKLCHKFYNKKSARATHCQSLVHYQKFKEATEEKIAAREKRLEEERLRKEKEAEEAMEEGDEEEKEENENGLKKENEGDDEQEDNEEGGEDEEEEDEEEEEEEDKDAMMEEDDILNEGGDQDNDDGGDDEDDQLDNDQDLSGSIGGDNDSATVGGTVESSSFMYVAGDVAQAHQELQALEQEANQKVAKKTGGEDVAGDSMTDVVATELSQTSLNPEECDDDLDLSVQEEDSSAAALATSTPVVEEAPEDTPTVTPTATKGKATARRGRGRGRAKK